MLLPVMNKWKCCIDSTTFTTELRVELFIYIFSTRVGLFFAVQNMANFSSNPGKLHLEGLVHLLRYIRDNKNLELKYYSKI